MYKHKDKCRICGSDYLTKFLDLGQHALANSFPASPAEFADEPKFPLAAYFCHNCNLAQLLDVVNKDMLFRDYVYFTSGIVSLLLSSGLSKDNHFYKYAEDIMRRYMRKGDFIVEIASNDGVVLKIFKERGYRILGVDPALNIAAIANEGGVETVADYFTPELAKNILTEHGSANVIMANNVVAHIDDHHGLVEGISLLLARDGIFVFEAPYLVDMFDNLTFDTIYHEHLSFLSVRPLARLFDRYGLEFFDIEIQSVQGKSLRGFVGHKGVRPVEPIARELIEKELTMGFDGVGAYLELGKRAEAQKEKLLRILRELKSQGKRIAAYGASAKGNTMLNYCQIGPDLIDYVLDDLPIKQHKFTPGMHIPTVDRAYASTHRPDYYLLLAWNYADNVLNKEKDFREAGGKFIIPVEGVKIV
jgi:SAM-dependent methyltransferase